MGEISLELIYKRLEEMQPDIHGVREELGRTNENVAAIARTQVSMQRDIRAIQSDLADLKDRVTVLTVAVDEHPPPTPRARPLLAIWAERSARRNRLTGPGDFAERCPCTGFSTALSPVFGDELDLYLVAGGSK
jgi:hypothetical protein